MKLALVSALILGLAPLPEGAVRPTEGAREETFHHLVFKDALVAVYDVVLPAGASTRLQVHSTNHLAVVIDSGTMISEAAGTESEIQSSGPPGALGFISAEPPLRQINVGLTPMRFIVAEVLSHAGGGQEAPPSKSPRGCSVIRDNDKIRAYRCLLRPGDSAGADLHARPFLRVSISPGLVERTTARGRRLTSRLDAGATSWHREPGKESLKNTGGRSFELVDIEWK